MVTAVAGSPTIRLSRGVPLWNRKPSGWNKNWKLSTSSATNNPNRTSFKSIVIAVAIIGLLPGACGVLIAGPGGILIYIGIVLVFSLIGKAFSLGGDKKDVEKEITEKTAILANLRTINRDSEV